MEYEMENALFSFFFVVVEYGITNKKRCTEKRREGKSEREALTPISYLFILICIVFLKALGLSRVKGDWR